MRLIQYLVRFSLSLFAIFFACSHGQAQVGNVTDTESTPIPGAGHNYIGMLNEIVNPSNGSLSIRIQVPIPPGRGLTIPFAFAYDSSGANPGIAPINSPPNNPALFQAGWSYSTPRLTALSTYKKVIQAGDPIICPYYTAFVFYDPQGGRHALNLAWEQSPQVCTELGIQNISNGGDPVVSATLGAVYDAAGTTYNLAMNGMAANVEDRNGNIIKFVDNGKGAFAATDTAGRTVLSSNGFGATGNTLTVSGLSNPYNLTWGATATWNYSAGLNLVFTPTNSSCNSQGYPTGQPKGSYTALSSLTLPNGESYTFTYDPTYGVVNQINYPTGGWVKYTWGVNSQSEIVFDGATDVTGRPNGYCAFRYNTPAVLKRQVSYDGTHIAEEQDFTYGTTWDSGTSYPDLTTWATKSSSVRTYDEVRSPSMGLSFITNYTYGSITIPIPPYESSGNLGTQVPVETQIVYNDFNGNLLKTVNKTWFNQFLMASEQTVWPNGLAAQTNFTYGPLGVLAEKDEYDYGQTTTPTRKTIYNYQSFPANPLGAAIDDRPCQVFVEDGSNNHYAETDYYYDGSTSSTPCSTAASQALPGSGSYTEHDETNYGTTSTAPRGNATKVTKLCFVGSQACTNSTTTATYDETGQILTSVSACGNASCSDVTASSYTTTYSYTDNYDSPPSTSTNAYLTKITNPLGQSATFEYAYSDGQLLKATDLNGSAMQYTYNDPLRRLTKSQFPDTGWSTLSYSDAAPAPSVTSSHAVASAISVTDISTLDGVGHPVQSQLTTDPDGESSSVTTYDGLGKPYLVYNPTRCATPTTNCGESTWGYTAYAYDGIGRSTSVTLQDGQVTTTAYSGNCTTVTDPAGNTRTACSDGLGRLTQVFEDPGSSPHLNYETDYTYDTLDNLLTVNQKGGSTNSANWRARQFVYDSLSRLTSATNPESGTASHVYDANGNLLSKTSPAPNQTGSSTVTVAYCYDALNRLLSKAYTTSTACNPQPSPVATYSYDQTTSNGLTVTNGIGRRTGMTDTAGSEAWSYDSMGRVLTDQRSTNGVTMSFPYTYNLDGSVATVNYPWGELVTFTPGGAGRPLSESGASIYGTTNYITAAHYTPGGTLCSLSSALLNATRNYAFNNRLQPQHYHITPIPWGGNNAPAPCSSPAWTAGWLDLAYTYVDANGHNNGNVVFIDDNTDAGKSQEFTYDSLNRLATAQTYGTHSGDPSDCWAETYTYDPWGNLYQYGANSTTQSAYIGCSQESGLNTTANTKNQLTSYNYDAAGNVISIPSVATYTYNAENQLTSTAGVTYTYDGDGKRVMKSSGTLYWYGLNSGPLMETNLTGAANFLYFFFNGQIVYRREFQHGGNNVDTYVLDQLGNANIVSGYSGEWDQSTYYPFGGERAYQSNVGNHYKFTGKERDPESGLDNFGARFNASSMGRFMSPDRGAMHFDNPQSLNRYTYALNNPLFYIDPDGEDSISAVYHLGSASRTTWIQNRQYTDLAAFLAPIRSLDFALYGKGVGIGQSAYVQTDPDNGVGGCTLGCIYGYSAVSVKTNIDISFSYNDKGDITSANISIAVDNDASWIGSSQPRMERTMMPGGLGFPDTIGVGIDPGVLRSLSPKQLQALLIAASTGQQSRSAIYIAIAQAVLQEQQRREAERQKKEEEEAKKRRKRCKISGASC